MDKIQLNEIIKENRLLVSSSKKKLEQVKERRKEIEANARDARKTAS